MRFDDDIDDNDDESGSVTSSISGSHQSDKQLTFIFKVFPSILRDAMLTSFFQTGTQTLAYPAQYHY